MQTPSMVELFTQRLPVPQSVSNEHFLPLVPLGSSGTSSDGWALWFPAERSAMQTPGPTLTP